MLHEFSEHTHLCVCVLVGVSELVGKIVSFTNKLSFPFNKSNQVASHRVVYLDNHNYGRIMKWLVSLLMFLFLTLMI